MQNEFVMDENVNVNGAPNMPPEPPESGTRKAGFVLSLIGTIGGAVTFVASIACVACAGAAVGGTLSYLGY